MSYTHYERLSALDAAFLELEDGNSHMHIGSVALFDASGLRGESGGIDFERILEATRWAIGTSIRFRQKIAYVPRLEHPVWVDDGRFNLRFHVRHTALPAPGSLRQLKRLAGRIMSQELDRGKPLWEAWYVEGVEGNRFAVITKLHHCLADGISGAELFAGMMGPSPEFRPGEPKPWVPRAAPSGSRLLADELSRRARMPLALMKTARRAARGGWGLEAVRGFGDAVKASLTPASDTPFNADLGPYRRFDWTRIDFDAATEVKQRFDAKLNDVVLAVATGALRRFLQGRGLRVAGIDFRAMVPVSVRSKDDEGALGNRVSQMLAKLPIDEPDPARRLARVLEMTRAMKRSGQTRGLDVLSELANWSGTGLITRLARLALDSRAVNLVITNVPGPRAPIYLLGARMLEVYPLVPLAAHQTLGIALFSYAGGLHWGFNADWDTVPDLHDLVEAVDLEFEALLKTQAARAPERP